MIPWLFSSLFLCFIDAQFLDEGSETKLGEWARASEQFGFASKEQREPDSAAKEKEERMRKTIENLPFETKQVVMQKMIIEQQQAKIKKQEELKKKREKIQRSNKLYDEKEWWQVTEHETDTEEKEAERPWFERPVPDFEDDHSYFTDKDLSSLSHEDFGIDPAAAPQGGTPTWEVDKFEEALHKQEQRIRENVARELAELQAKIAEEQS